MTLVLIRKGLVLEGSRLKIEDKQVPGIQIQGFDLFKGFESFPQSSKWVTENVSKCLQEKNTILEP